MPSLIELIDAFNLTATSYGNRHALNEPGHKDNEYLLRQAARFRHLAETLSAAIFDANAQKA